MNGKTMATLATMRRLTKINSIVTIGGSQNFFRVRRNVHVFDNNGMSALPSSFSTCPTIVA
jgi:hypothetical protein